MNLTKPTTSDEYRWMMAALAGGNIRKLAKLAMEHGVPKHVVVEMFSDAYDNARFDARSPQ